MKKVAFISATVCAAALALTSAFAATPKPVHWNMTAKLGHGDHVTAHLHATIQQGWHLYALDQTPGGPVATRIRLAPHQPFTLSGDVGEGMPRHARDPNFNIETSFFLGQATFTLPLKAASRAKAEHSRVVVDVLYQTCNDRLCLPPQVAKVTAAVKP